VSDSTFADHLAALDAGELTRLVAARPEVCLEPTPRTYAELAQRLSDPQSLVSALHRCDADAVTVGLVIAGLGERADHEHLLEIARRLAPADVADPAPHLDGALTELLALGLCFPTGEGYRLPQRLNDHFRAEVGGNRPLAKIVGGVRVDDLRPVVDVLGLEPASGRKNDLVAALGAFFGNPAGLADEIAGLPDDSMALLGRLRYGSGAWYPGAVDLGAGGARASPALGRLREHGLVYQINYALEVPVEVAFAAALASDLRPLTGPPELDPAGVEAERAVPASTAAAQGAVQAVTRLLDAAENTPIAALKKGGVGVRERTRVAKKLSFAEDELPLWLDIGGASALMRRGAGGYVPGEDYAQWREADPATRWARLAAAWCALAHAPSYREEVDDRTVPPPLAQPSLAGVLRRAILRTARGGASVRSGCAHLDWFAPLHDYDGEELDGLARACVDEAERLGVTTSDALSPLGERLADVAHLPEPGRAGELACRCAGMLPETEGSIVLQSDMTAVVSGQPSAAASRLLHEAAVAETRGAAGMWRFTRASVRHAMDRGWTVDDLLSRLAELTGRAVPQPLAYLVSDVARRHGNVRVREVTTCIVAGEAEVQELLHAKALRGLELRALAPTVLASSAGSEQILAKLRGAGFAPMPEDSGGAVILPEPPDADRGPRPSSHGGHRAARDRVASAEDVVAGLRAGPRRSAGAATDGDSQRRLAALNSDLGEAELRMLAHALEVGGTVTISYRSKTGARTIREIQPRVLYGRWLDSFCLLRGDQRDFTVANIEAVSPG
jgi:hypothetical protein